MGKPERIEDALQARTSVRRGEHDRDEDRPGLSDVQDRVDEAPLSGRAGLVRKLAEVMAAVHRIPKRGKNAFHNYEYATETDIAEAIRSELASRHIMLIPSVEHVDWRELPAKDNGKARGYIAFMTMTFEFIDGETGASIAKRWCGSGEDAGDKSPYKAMTGAVKYFLMKCFLIPTGDDPEADRPQDRSNKQQRQQPRREVTTRDGARVDPTTGEETAALRPNGTTGHVFIDGKQQKQLIDASKESGWSNDDRAVWLKQQGYGEWSKIPAADFTSVFSVMQHGTDGGAQ